MGHRVTNILAMDFNSYNVYVTFNENCDINKYYSLFWRKMLTDSDTAKTLELSSVNPNLVLIGAIHISDSGIDKLKKNVYKYATDLANELQTCSPHYTATKCVKINNNINQIGLQLDPNICHPSRVFVDSIGSQLEKEDKFSSVYMLHKPSLPLAKFKKSKDGLIVKDQFNNSTYFVSEWEECDKDVNIVNNLSICEFLVTRNDEIVVEFDVNGLLLTVD